MAVNWYFDGTAKVPREDKALTAMRAAPPGTNPKYCIQWDSQASPTPVRSRKDLELICDFWADLVRDPNYFRLNGKAVIILGKMDHFWSNSPTGFGGTGIAYNTKMTPTEMINMIRERVGVDLYIVGLGTLLGYWVSEAKAGGLDCISSYNLYFDWTDRDGNAPKAGPQAKTFAELHAVYVSSCEWLHRKCLALGLDMWVPTTSGFDNTPWRSGAARSTATVCGRATPQELVMHWEWARDFMARCERCTGLLHYAANEWGEGGYFFATKVWGHLKQWIFRRVFGK